MVQRHKRKRWRGRRREGGKQLTLPGPKRARTKLLQVFWCPVKLRSGRAERTSHSRTALSREEERSWVPLGLSWTEVTW